MFLVKLIVFQVTKSKLMRQLAVSKLAQTAANTLGVLSARNVRVLDAGARIKLNYSLVLDSFELDHVHSST